MLLAGFRGAEAEAIPLIEAASRTGQTELAADVFRRLAETTSIAQTDWGRGSMRVHERCSAMVRTPSAGIARRSSG